MITGLAFLTCLGGDGEEEEEEDENPLPPRFTLVLAQSLSMLADVPKRSASFSRSQPSAPRFSHSSTMCFRYRSQPGLNRV